jgi:spore coat polysaccharide biosynthesis protein SpsF
LYPVNNFFNVLDIITLFKQKPWLKLINGNIMQKRFDMTVEEEIQLAMEFCELQELNLVSKYLDSLLK